MGFLAHLVETQQASLYKIVGELPSMSRPMYETNHTGLPSSEHGIVANSMARLSTKPNIFQVLRDAGKVTAAAAYSWFFELYNRAPYNPIDDKEVDDESLPIQHGRFYTEDEYPDVELFYTAAQGMSTTRLDTPLDPEVVAIALAHPLAQSSAVVRVVSVGTESGSVDLVAATPDPLLDARILLRVHKPLTSLAAEEIASGKPPSQRHGEGNYSFTDPKRESSGCCQENEGRGDSTFRAAGCAPRHGFCEWDAPASDSRGPGSISYGRNLR
jgi:hypothetical protein